MDHLLRNSGNRDWWGDLVAPPPNQFNSLITLKTRMIWVSEQHLIPFFAESLYMVPILMQMMQRLIAATLMLTMMTAAFAGCTGGDDDGLTQDDVDQAREEGRLAGIAEATPVSTLDTVMARDSLKCGVKESQWGMGFLSTDGVRSGLDVEYCKAIAAAIGLDPMTQIEWIPASSQDRFEKLASEEIDVLIRTTTWTTSRDADLNADFAGINFYDGQGILIRGDAVSNPGADSYTSSALTGANICVGTGTTTEGNLADWNTVNSVGATVVGVADAAEGTQKLVAGECDAFTGDMSAMVAKKYTLELDGTCADCQLWIAPELLSKEPLAAAVRDNDDDWKDVVEWVWFGMVTAEEMSITSDNYATADTSVPAVDRLLNSNLGLGTEANPLPDTWMQSVLSAVGNYGEAYDNSFCDGTYDGHSGSAAMTGCVLDRAGTDNALVSEGGLQFAPPMR